MGPLLTAFGFVAGNWQRLVIYAVVVAAVLTTVWFHGLFTGRSALHEYKAEQATLAANIVVKRGAVSEKVVIKYVTKTVPRTRVVRETVEKEVIRYVDRQVDTCPLSVAGRVLHDAAAANAVPDPTGAADDSPSGLKTSALVKTSTENYAICHENADRLRGLQEWAREQAKVKL